jgi:hypothetical protein
MNPIVVALFALQVSIGIAAAQLAAPGFFKCEDYLGLNLAERTIYCSGVVDGILASGVVGMSDDQMKKIYAALRDVSNAQAEAVITKYIRARPEQWRVRANALAVAALREAFLKEK